MRRAIVLMGVAGAGKSTVGALLARQIGGRFIEGDRLHPASSRRKMSRGEPLDDADRAPWLDAVVTAIRQELSRGVSVVVACSALRRAYRDQLRQAHQDLCFIHLSADAALLKARLQQRTGHFMSPGLLDSQLATLEPLSSEVDGLTIELGRSDGPAQIAARIARALGE